MSIINLRQKEIVGHVVIIGMLLSSCGCGFLNLLPNSERDKWYMEHTDDINKVLALQSVPYGMTRKEILKEWGEPWKVINSDHWIYYFPDIAKEKTHIQFKNDAVAKRWTIF